MIAVQFDCGTERDVLESVDLTIVEHESMSRKRVVEELKLEGAIAAEFHESEVLDDENPWFCPSCHSHQRAHKSLSIWRSPPILMVYLKRFIFHDMMPIKVDEAVAYPMELKLSERATDRKYFLEALVCHYGGQSPCFPIRCLLIASCHPMSLGVSAGHYTAYAKHSVSGKWLYCNDSSITCQEPSLNDERAYILFYRRSGLYP